jgi:hypothetical protein
MVTAEHIIIAGVMDHGIGSKKRSVLARGCSSEAVIESTDLMLGRVTKPERGGMALMVDYPSNTGTMRQLNTVTSEGTPSITSSHELLYRRVGGFDTRTVTESRRLICFLDNAFNWAVS